MSKKMLIFGIPIFLLAVLGGVLWVVKEKSEKIALKKQNEERIAQMQNKQNEPKQSDNLAQSSNVDTSNWKTYRSEEYGFEVKYPAEWIVTVPNKNEYGEVVSLTSGDTDSKLVGAQNQGGDNIVIHFFSNINEEIHLKSIGNKVKNLEEFLSLNTSQTEMVLIEKTELHNRPAYVVGTFGLTGHYGIIFESKSGIYEIIFEKTNLSTDQGGLLENKLENALSRQEIGVFDSFKLL